MPECSAVASRPVGAWALAQLVDARVVAKVAAPAWALRKEDIVVILMQTPLSSTGDRKTVLMYPVWMNDAGDDFTCRDSRVMQHWTLAGFPTKYSLEGRAATLCGKSEAEWALVVMKRLRALIGWADPVFDNDLSAALGGSLNQRSTIWLQPPGSVDRVPMLVKISDESCPANSSVCYKQGTGRSPIKLCRCAVGRKKASETQTNSLLCSTSKWVL